MFTPFGGAHLYPLQAAVCAPLEPTSALAVARRLLALGADPNIRWRDCGGQHTPLGKALALRNFQLAELLAEHGAGGWAGGGGGSESRCPGIAKLNLRKATKTALVPCSPADCTTTLLSTDFLEGSHFDPLLLKWLLDRGADVVGPAMPSSSADSGAGPAVAVLLRKLRRELHVTRQLSKLYASAGSGQEQGLLRCAAASLVLLLAAGATPAGAPDPSGAMAAAVAALQPGNWAAVQEAATRPPRWSPATHHLFPAAFHRAARVVLLAARRGFATPCAAHGSGNYDAGAGERQQQQQCGSGRPVGQLVAHGRAGAAAVPQAPPGQVYLDGHVVLHIIKHMAPCTQL